MNKRIFTRSLIAATLALVLSAPAFSGQAILNLKDADIRVVIEQISKLTGKTFVLDPRVQSMRVTILSQHMMDEQEIYDTFLTILKINGLAAVETGKVTKIVQEQSARQDSVQVYKEGHRYGPDELITRVIKVEHVDATQMVPALRALVPQQGHLVQYPRTNVLIIHDTAANIERIVEIIRQIDKASEAEVEIIPLRHASADEVVRIIENLDKGAKQGGEETINKPNIAADVRTNSILVRAEGPERLKMRSMIAQLDTAIESGGNTKVIFLHYAKADDLVKVLTGVSKQIQKEENKKGEGAAAGGGGGGSGGSRGDNYTIDAHAETNSIVVSAPPDMMRSLEAVIRQLDIRRKQVHVEAIIVEISDNLSKQLGVQWLFGGSQPGGFTNFNNTGAGISDIAGAAAQAQGHDTTASTTDVNGLPHQVTTNSGGDGGKALAGVLSGIQGIGIGAAHITGSGFSFGAFLQALGATTDSNVLSTPSVTTMDNEEAEILVGQEIPIITGSTLGGNNTNPFQQVNRKEIGIKLKIKPQINEGDSVKLTIEQEVSNIAGSTGVDIVTNKRQIKNTVMVYDGETLILGGLIDDNVQESVEKVPVLGDLPLIGNLFKSQKSTKVKRNLMVFLKPTIMRDHNETITSSAKYNYLRAKQLDEQRNGINLMPEETTALLPEYMQPKTPVVKPAPAPDKGSNEAPVPVSPPPMPTPEPAAAPAATTTETPVSEPTR